MCNCKDMARDPAAELEGKSTFIPLSKHHPKCEDYKAKHYAKISYCDAGALITEFDMVNETINAMLDGDSSIEDYQVSSIILTNDQYENLPEFDGF